MLLRNTAEFISRLASQEVSMSSNLYVAGSEAGSGKSAVVLGILQLVTRNSRNVGFFRPLIRRTEPKDSLIDLVAQHFKLSLPYEHMYGCTEETARKLLAEGGQEELQKEIIEKYKALDEQCDFVVCVGTDHLDVAPYFEFDFNVEVANNLGCQLMPIASGHDKSATDVVDSLGLLLGSLDEKGCDVVAAVVNRVNPDRVDDVNERIKTRFSADLPVFVLPENSLLDRPTVGEIATALDAQTISGNSETLNREVQDYSIAAMELPNFLERLGYGTLVLTPADRSDIVLASLLSYESSTYPKIAGVLLTGGIEPAPQLKRLLEGIPRPPIPVIKVDAETFKTATNLNSIEGTIAPASERKIAAALGMVEDHVDLARVQERASMSRSTRMTPLMFQYELIRRARSDRKHIVLPEGDDERILRAAEMLMLRHVVDLTLLGEPDTIRERIRDLGLRLEEVNVIDPTQSPLRKSYAETYFELRKHKGIAFEMALDMMSDVSYFGTMMVHRGDADGMVSGAVHTTQHTIRPALEFVRTRPGSKVVSSVFFMCLEDRVLVYGDCAVNPDPNAEQLADIATTSAETAKDFGIDPRVAMLSYSTGESGKGADVEKVREATRMAREQRPDLKIEGPIQYDAAVDASVAKSKLPDSEVAGQATVFIFPDLNTGNNTYKAVQRSAGAVAVGPVLQGLNKPVNDLSRGCLVEDIVNTVAITAIQAQMTT